MARAARPRSAPGINSPLSGEGSGLHRVVDLLGLCRGLLDHVQPVQRVVDIGRQRDQHHADHVAGLARFLLGPHGDGNAGVERAARKLSRRIQVAPDTAADDRQDHVVDGRPGHRVADLLGRGQVEAEAVRYRLVVARAVEARGSEGRGVACRLGAPLEGPHLREGAQHPPVEASRAHGKVERRPHEEVGRAGRGLRVPVVLGSFPTIRLQVVQGAHEARSPRSRRWPNGEP